MELAPIESGSDKNFHPECLLKLVPGEYELYLEYADGSTIAPVLTGDRTIWQGNSTLIGQGTYQREPCKFSVKDVCLCNIVHLQEMGYISVQTQNFIEADFCKFNPTFLIDGQELPMNYDAEKNEYYWIVADCKPGKMQFQIKNNLYNKIFGFGAYSSSSDCPDVFYKGYCDDYSYMGLERYEDDEPIYINVLDYASIADKKISCSSTKILFRLYQYEGWINMKRTAIGYTPIEDNGKCELKLLVDDTEHGSVVGTGTYPIGSTASVYAQAKEGFCFKSWSDGVTDNHRLISLYDDYTVTALFEPESSESYESIPLPKYLHIITADNVDTKYSFGSTDGSYVKKTIDFKGGIYQFYFENADGSIFALNESVRLYDDGMASNRTFCNIKNSTKQLLRVEQSCVVDFILTKDCFINIYAYLWKDSPVVQPVTVPKYLHIVDSNGNDTQYDFVKAVDNIRVSTKFKAGEHSFYFENADGSTFSPPECEINMNPVNYYYSYYDVISSSRTRLNATMNCDIDFIINVNTIDIYGYNFTYTPTVTAPVANTLTYNGKPQRLATAGSTVFGSLVYSLDGNNFSVEIPTATESGSYTVYYKVEGDSNVESTEPQSVTVTISKAKPTVIAPVANTLTYNGKPQSLATAGSTDFGTLVYSLDGTNFSAEIPTATEAGDYTVYYKVEESNNLEKAEGSVAVTINTPTPVSEIGGASNAKVWSCDKTIFIETSPDAKYTVIDVNGRIIVVSTTKTSREEIQINQTGLFVVIVSGRQYKVFVN